MTQDGSPESTAVNGGAAAHGAPSRDADDVRGNHPAVAAETHAPSPDASPVAEPAGHGDHHHGFVYAIGRIVPRFPTMAVEKEFAQVAGRSDTADLTDREALRAVLSHRENRYLVRRLCWTFTVEGLDTYILQPQDPVDFELLTEALRPSPRATDTDVVIGVRGPVAPPERCNGLMLPVVAFSQIYSFDVDSLIERIPRPEGVDEERFSAAAEEMLMRVMQMADNAGATDEHRALNYLAVRYPAVYETAAAMFEQDCGLAAVEVRPSPLGSTQNVVEVIFSFADRRTDVVEKRFARVDVTEEFPFLVTKMGPYYDR